MLRCFGPDCTPAAADSGSPGTIPSGARWIDLLDPSEIEEKLAEDALGQNIPTREEMAEIEPSSRLYQRKGALLMTATVLHGISRSQPDAEPISFILTDRLLVTVRYVDPKPFRLFAEHLADEPELAADPMTILVRLLDTIIDRLADELERTGREIEEAAAQVFARSAKASGRQRNPEFRLEALLFRLGAIQRLLAEIRESAVSTGRMLGFLADSDFSSRSDKARHIESLQEDIRGLLEHSNALTENLAFLLNTSLGLINLEQNFVMKIFSVVAVVFMPPTLIAGIYGMNFENMPELEWVLGYPFALGLILISAVLPYWIARRRGWL